MLANFTGVAFPSDRRHTHRRAGVLVATTWPHVRRAGLLFIACAFATGVLLESESLARGMWLVVRGADVQGPLRIIANLAAVPITEQAITLPLRDVTVRARLYLPLTPSRQTALLTPGLQPGGIDDARFVAISRELARSGVRVLTPDFPELRRLEIEPELTNEIEQAALWLAIDSGLARHKRIGLMGVSLSGGLTVVAAGRPSLRDHVSYVFVLGGHDDLPRVVRYLVSGEVPQPPGPRPAVPERRRPHDYGQALILLAVADRLVPPDQVAALTAAVRRFLDASYEERIDQDRASEAMEALWQTARMLPEPAAGLLSDVLSRDVTRLGPRLQPYVGPFGQSNALSPARSPLPSAPVFLLHGVGDRLVPTEESEYLAERLQSTTPVRLLTTGVIAHAEVDQRATATDIFRLARFWGELLDR